MSWTQGRLSATVGRRPDGLPMLARGGQRSPEQGACLMEYVSRTRRNPVQRPSRVHPSGLGAAGPRGQRRGRRSCRPVPAGGAGSRPDRHPGRDPRITLTVMACCLRAAVAPYHPAGRDLPLALERIDAQLDRLAAQRGRRWARLRTVGSGTRSACGHLHAARGVVRRTHRFRGPRHDDQLCELLERAVADCRELLAQHAQPGPPASSLSPQYVEVGRCARQGINGWGAHS